MTKEDALQLLLATDFVYGNDEDTPDGDHILNMNDVWGWATAWGERVSDEDLPEVARLVRAYGWCGAVYWVSIHHDNMRSEFEDINRFVEFVRQEEIIRHELPNSSARAYAGGMSERCTASFEIGDNFGDNYATMRCQLEKNHTGNHCERWNTFGQRRNLVVEATLSWKQSMRKAHRQNDS